jgi:hypothetical protein
VTELEPELPVLPELPELPVLPEVPVFPELDEVEEDELAVGVEDGCCRLVVVVVEAVVLPWDVSAAANENRPARPIAPAIAQRLIRLSNRRPRSRGVWSGGVMTLRVGATRKRVVSRR